ncbi:Hypothetical protein POVR1_LOCUS348 [uncultured virus]|nr:Hypothetical protein POVR1_LOCUS348 [uncultured virus]
MDTQQVPKDFTERVCWVSQAFEHDLLPEDKGIFIDAAKKASVKGMILKFAFFDGPLMERNGFLQILKNLTQSLKKAENFSCHS